MPVLQVVTASWLAEAAFCASSRYKQCKFSIAALPWRGSREATTSAGGGSSAKERASSYLREKERRQETGEVHDDAPRSRLAEAAAEFRDAQQQAFLLSSPSGLGVGAEAAIAQAIKEGALDNLAGKGKPLAQEDHGTQFYRVDPLVQAVTRTMGAQNVRPQSLELRDELQRELAGLRAALAAEMRAAVAAEADSSAEAPGAAPAEDPGSRQGESGKSGWFGRLLGGRGDGGGTGAADVAPRRHSVASIRLGQHAGLQYAADRVRQLIKEYNSAVLSDKETHGAFWPLEQSKQLDWAAEVDTALAAVGQASSKGRGASCISSSSKAG